MFSTSGDQAVARVMLFGFRGFLLVVAALGVLALALAAGPSSRRALLLAPVRGSGARGRPVYWLLDFTPVILIPVLHNG